jgi:hypothetical protein
MPGYLSQLQEVDFSTGMYHASSNEDYRNTAQLERLKKYEDVLKSLTLTVIFGFSLHNFSFIDCCSDKQKQTYGDTGRGARLEWIKASGCLLNSSFHFVNISCRPPTSFVSILKNDLQLAITTTI